MDIVRSHLEKMNLWPVEHFFVGATADDKYAQKSVQLVRGSSFRSDYLQNPYFITKKGTDFYYVSKYMNMNDNVDQKSRFLKTRGKTLFN